MTRSRSIDGLRPDEVDLEVMNAFHLGGNLFSASVQLSDEHNEIGRSFLLKLQFEGKTLRYDVLLQIENLMLGHVSRGPNDHVTLEIGGTTHFLRGASDTTRGTPDLFFNKLWHLDRSVFVYGEEGTVCEADGNGWRRIRPVTEAFLRAMHGPRRQLIHVAGDDGTLLRLAGDGWTQIPLSFNRSINALQVAADGRVSMGCEDGYCFQYFQESLDEIDAPDGDYFSICEFNGKRYWGDDQYGLYVQKDLKLVPFRPLEFVYSMNATDDFLVAVGWKEVFVFDGSVWSGFEFGYDGTLYARVVDMNRRYR